MPPDVKFLTPQEVSDCITAGNAYVVDVREPNEWEVVHIAEAKLVPLSTFDPAEIAPPSGKTLIIHCRSGRRCGLATEQLQAAGYEGQVHRMSGGMIAWEEAGLPVEHGVAK